MSNLQQFLLDVGSDPDKAAAFKADPDAVMDQYGLTDAEKEAVRSSDRQRMGEMIPEEGDLHRNVEVNFI